MPTVVLACPDHHQGPSGTKRATCRAAKARRPAAKALILALPCRAGRAATTRPRPSQNPSQRQELLLTSHTTIRSSSRARASHRSEQAQTTRPMATTTMLPLWAQAAELERQFEGYKRRLAERRDAAAVATVSDRRRDGGGDGAGEKEKDEEEVEEEVGRGRRYEAYVRRRDEKLRQGWLARMERKEAEMKALWARLDAGRHRPGDVGLAATASPAREQKPRSMEKPASPATPKCIPDMKLPRLRTATACPSPTAASPRLPSSRRASHPEPPTTPRKENRIPPPSTAATPRPLKTLSRTRSSLKDSSKEERGSVSSSSSSSVRGESPRPPRFQPPRASYDGGAGGAKVKQAAAPAQGSADAAVAAARSRFHEQVVLAEIKTAAAVSPGPLRIRRSGNGVARASSPSVALGHGQVDFLTRLGNSDCNDVQVSEHSDAGAKNSSNKADGNGDGEVTRSGDKLGDAGITGDSDTEPSYVYVKREHEEVGDKEAAEVFEDTMASTPSSETMSSSPSSETTAAASNETGTSVKESSGSLYSNVQSSFSHGSELDASAAGSPLRTPPPSGGALSTEELLEADAAMLRMKREEEDEVEEAEHQNIVFLPSTCCAARSVDVPVAGTPQSPMDAVAGLKRFLTFGKKNVNGADGSAVVIERAPPPAADSDDLDSSYAASPHVRSLQSFVPLSPARSQLKEMALPAKSPRVPRSFFSFSSFKNRGT
uniref:Uncharacterized protein n=1 Tax=Hordeum vulgare subsp. vulgare TaxID=112509 RepID=A0A8I6Z7Z2_HORVV